MGNTFTKKEDEHIDGGYVFPLGLVYKKTDCDLRIVRKLITERRLAPFYKGEEDQTETHVIECPICLLYLPANINYSRCCRQPICTECFLQIKQPTSGGAAVCPFCVQAEFGITYAPPVVSAQSNSPVLTPSTSPPLPSSVPEPTKRKMSLPSNAPNVVTIDHVRPNGRHPEPQSDVESHLRRVTLSGSSSRRAGSQTTRVAIRSSSSRRIQTHDTDIYGTSRTRSASNVHGSGSSRRTIIPSTYTPGQRMMSAELTADLEHMMLLEAIRLSLLESQPQSTSAMADAPTRSRSQSESSSSSSSGDEEIFHMSMRTIAAGE